MRVHHGREEWQQGEGMALEQRLRTHIFKHKLETVRAKVESWSS